MMLSVDLSSPSQGAENRAYEKAEENPDAEGG
jgi:hypothetical protein